MSASGEPAPTRAQIERAIRRAGKGQAIDDTEARSLLAARGDQLTNLMAVAAGLRDQGLQARGLGPIITYSPKVFIPLTKLCRDSCHYCTFAASPAALRGRGESMFLEPW